MKLFGFKIKKNKSLLPAIATLTPLSPGEEIYGITSPVSMSFPWLATIAEGIAWVLLVYISLKLLFWLLTPSKRKRKKLPPPDPQKEALKALERLKKSPIWTNFQDKDVCEKLTSILKVFLKKRFDLGLGVASTSDEIIETMYRQNISGNLIKFSQDLFGICDSIKYAKGELMHENYEELYEQVKSLLLREDWLR